MNFFIEKVLVPLLLKTVHETATPDFRFALSKSKLMGVVVIAAALILYGMGQIDMAAASSAVVGGVYAIIDRNSRTAETAALAEKVGQILRYCHTSHVRSRGSWSRKSTTVTKIASVKI